MVPELHLEALLHLKGSQTEFGGNQQDTKNTRMGERNTETHGVYMKDTEYQAQNLIPMNSCKFFWYESHGIGIWNKLLSTQALDPSNVEVQGPL